VRTSAWCKPKGSGASGPGQAEVGRVRVTGEVQPDLVELGEVAVVASHDHVVLGNAGLVGEHPDIGLPALAFEADIYRLAGTQVAASGERRADEQEPVVARVGDWNGVASPGFAAHDIERDHPAARDAA
jgi:hypothetical protein